MSGIDTDAVKTAYEDVRDDRSETSWVFLKYKDNKIVCDSVGTGFEEFKSKFTDDERGFGFIRLVTGDEMSKRSKFALITWIGQDVSTLKKAKVSTDKGLVKQIIQLSNRGNPDVTLIAAPGVLANDTIILPL
ncbi:coactosin-like protein [Saccoglossus kowalevskii]|uniref:Coactosin-like protein-like n=1 Tax=Saccoglossus kowalevskii TaxID=10224 RepID=A0ABM0MEJ6_SACKO|nr:PREDICTED: coactosin-like protein-like [Saccoglossus kowalevskii]